MSNASLVYAEPHQGTQASKMPGGSFTVEFWARGGAASDDAQQQRSTNLFSYATESLGTGGCEIQL
eukprot:1161929-Pelagomonas_calceolata.AAC.12